METCSAMAVCAEELAVVREMQTVHLVRASEEAVCLWRNWEFILARGEEVELS